MSGKRIHKAVSNNGILKGDENKSSLLGLHYYNLIRLKLKIGIRGEKI